MVGGAGGREDWFLFRPLPFQQRGHIIRRRRAGWRGGRLPGSNQSSTHLRPACGNHRHEKYRPGLLQMMINLPFSTSGTGTLVASVPAGGRGAAGRSTLAIPY